MSSDQRTKKDIKNCMEFSISKTQQTMTDKPPQGAAAIIKAILHKEQLTFGVHRVYINFKKNYFKPL
jgi:hypothetical protein